MRQLRDEGQIIEDPEVTEYLQALGSRIVAPGHAAIPRSASTFFFVRDDTINAFALPGGFIGVNYGLVLATRNEAQLAGVLAHEIAHVTQRHIARRIRSQGRQSIATMAAMLAAILIGAATGSSDAALGGISMAQGAAMQQQINFTRANENEADRVGMGFLAAAGFDPYGMPDFFETMGRRTSLAATNRNALPEILQSHPVTTNRIAESRARAAQFKDIKQTAGERELRADARTPARARDARRKTTCGATTPTGASSRTRPSGERYGEALASYQAGNARAALDSLTELAREYPQVPMLQSTLGQALMSAGRHRRGARHVPARARRSRRAICRSPCVTPRRCSRPTRPKTAHAVLLDLFNNVAPTPEQIRFTALAASSAGDTGDAAYYMSEYHIATGNLPLSVAQLEMALAAPNITARAAQPLPGAPR